MACPSSTLTLTDWRPAKALFVGVSVPLAITVATFYIPVVNDLAFGQAPLSWEWGVVAVSVVLLLAFSEAYKLVKRRVLGTPPRPSEILAQLALKEKSSRIAQGLELAIEDAPAKRAPAGLAPSAGGIDESAFNKWELHRGRVDNSRSQQPQPAAPLPDLLPIVPADGARGTVGS
eukprot:tig00001496_g9200.t1